MWRSPGNCGCAERRGSSCGCSSDPTSATTRPTGSGPGAAQHVPDIADRDVYVCGPPAMVDAMRRRLRALGVPEAACTTNASPTEETSMHRAVPVLAATAGGLALLANFHTSPATP